MGYPYIKKWILDYPIAKPLLIEISLLAGIATLIDCNVSHIVLFTASANNKVTKQSF
jgi:hypothetical protein